MTSFLMGVMKENGKNIINLIIRLQAKLEQQENQDAWFIGYNSEITVGVCGL